MAYDLKGKTFNKLKVIELERVDSSRHKIWKCICECGNEISVRATDLISGKTSMCSSCKKKLHSLDKNKAISKDVEKESINNIRNNDEKYENISDFTDKNLNMFSIPIIFKIVHAINLDLTYIEDAEKIEDFEKDIDKFFKISQALEDLNSITWDSGEVINTNIVYHLLVKKDNNDLIDYDIIDTCIKNLKNLAYNNGDFYLAFPKTIYSNELIEWNKFKDIIIKYFANSNFQILLI